MLLGQPTLLRRKDPKAREVQLRPDGRRLRPRLKLKNGRDIILRTSLADGSESSLYECERSTGRPEGRSPNAWLVLSEDESMVLGSAATYAEAVELATGQGVDDPVLIKTPEEWLVPVY